MITSAAILFMVALALTALAALLYWTAICFEIDIPPFFDDRIRAVLGIVRAGGIAVFCLEIPFGGQ